MISPTILDSFPVCQVLTNSREPIGPPAIARIHFPNGEEQYVPHVRNHQGFVVQRHYVGVGRPRHRHEPSSVGRVGRIWKAFDSFTPQRRPVLSAAALAAAGLDYRSVCAWVECHGEEVFDHPTYAGLCLRWGKNAHGLRVEPVEEAERKKDALMFTLRTDARAGCTHCHLQTPLGPGDALLHELRTHAGLRLGDDAEFSAGYSTRDYAAAHRLVTERGLEWVWLQRYSVYDVTVSFPEPHRLPWRTRFATAEKARQWYDHLPSAPAPQAACPVATLSRAEVLEHRQFADQHTAQKCLPAEWQGEQLRRPAETTAPVAWRLDLTAWDLPPDEATTTVAGLLDAKDLSRAELGRQIGIQSSTIYHRSQHPTSWTVGNLLAIAKYTQRPVGEVLDLLIQEMNSWE